MVEVSQILTVVFCIFNGILALGAILIIAAGGYALSGALSEIIPVQNFEAIAGIIVAVGVFALLISVLGFVGGIKRHSYFVLLLLIAIIQFAEAIGAFALRPSLDDLVGQGWSYAYRNNATGVLHSIQNLLTCCGFQTTADMPAYPCPVGATAGCFLQIHDTTQSQMVYIGVASIIIVIFEVGALIVSCLLTRAGGRGQSKYEEERAGL